MEAMTTAPDPDRTRHGAFFAAALGGRALDDLRLDLRFALRDLRRRPTFTVVAALTIAVGMAATTAMFSLTNAILLRQPPVVAPQRVFAIWELRSGDVRESMEGRLLDWDRYEGYRDRGAEVFDGLAGHAYATVSVVTDQGALVSNGFLTSGNYFDVLGLVPGVGRLYAADDEDVVVLSDRFWRSRYGADPAVVGRRIAVDSRPFTIAGVAPEGFVGTMAGFTGDVWIPARAYARLTGLTRDASYVVPIGRLRDGVGRAAAEERLSAIAVDLPPPRDATVRGVQLDGLLWRADLRGPLELGLGLMVGTSLLLLLVACANITGMMLARAYDRRREVAVRLAIGAGRGRLVRQIVTESVLTALLGGAAGVALATLAMAALSTVEFPIAATITLDATPDPVVLLLSFALAAGAGMLLGLGPALRSAGTDLTTSLKEGAQAPRFMRRRNAFVVGQLAVSTLLLVTAGLFVRSASAVSSVPLGFDPTGVVVGSLSLAPHGYDEGESRSFYRQLLEGVRALPGVESVSLARFVLLGGANASNGGRAADGGENAPSISIGYNVVDPAYFETNGMELVAGRGFTDEDAEGAPRVAVINQTLAERMWPGRSPLGRSYLVGRASYEVVGVLKDGVYVFQYEDPRAFAYYPYAQRYGSNQSLHVRSAAPVAETMAGVRRVVAELDPNVGIAALRTMDAVVSSNGFIVRFVARLTALFAALGLMLSAVGVYGLLAMQVAQRGREFGVRLALGATSGDVALLVVRKGIVPAALGCVAGLLVATATARFVASLLYGVAPLDPLAMGVAPASLLAAAAVASVVPARRATRVSPTVTLREE